MAFPNSPSNGQLATVNNIVYIYNSTKGVWNKANVAAPLAANTISITGNITTSGNLNITGNTNLADITSNITLSGTGTRIRGDFSNATVANRVMFQSSTVNGQTNIYAIPNGSGTTGVWSASNSNDPNNASIGQLAQLSTELRIQNVITGTGTYLPMTFYTGGSERVKIDASTGNVVIVPTTTSTSTTTGALVVRGGVGVGGSINAAANIKIGTSTGTESLTIGTAGNIRFQASSKVRIEYLNTDGTYVLGTTGGAAVVFDTVSGVHQEIAFETHNTGNYHREHMRINKDGAVTQPYQPSFYANGPSSNQTLGNQGDLVMNSAKFNYGNHYNTTNYRFTAPVAGRYLFTWSVFLNSATGRCSIKVNGGNYHNLQMDVGGGMGQAAIINLNANDYVTVGDWQNLSGMQYWGEHAHFSGILLG